MDRSTIFHVSGAASIFLGAALLNAFLSFQFAKRVEGAPEFPFAGSANHLISGLIPLVFGILLTVAAEQSAFRILAYWTAALQVGLPIALAVAIILVLTSQPLQWRPAIGWFAIVVYAVVISAGVRWGFDLWRSPSHGSPVAWGVLVFALAIMLVSSRMAIDIWRVW